MLLLPDELTDVLARTEIADPGITSCGWLSEETTPGQIRVVRDQMEEIRSRRVPGPFSSTNR